mmetsp:Transcript_102988/g.320951  ORF Transcript_102988/g.320951 Transcript_102988/m.320951 type:complete len:246 (+) Transcript_102988:1137-1874(+)
MDVVLVDLVRQQHQALPLSEPKDALHGLAGQHLACGVARVDDRDSAGHAPTRAEVRDGALQLVQVDTPAGLLVEEVAHGLPAQQRHRGAVEGVLRDRQQHAILGASDSQLQDRLNGGRSTVREEDVLHVRLRTVPRGEEGGNVLPEDGMPLGVGVGADAAVRDALEVAGRSLSDVRGEEAVPLHQRGLRKAGEDLPVEQQGPLAHCLRVADVAGNDGVEGERLLILSRQRPVRILLLFKLLCKLL